MGAVSFSIDLGLVAALKKALLLDVFVETGTYHGDTVESVREHFDTIYSVELSPEHHEAARLRFAGKCNIELACGDSAGALTKWKQSLRDRSVLYFLDAHWCVAENTAGETSQCPLLDEIRAIGRLNTESLIVIDDARLFLAPPPSPHEINHWPDFNAVLCAMQSTSSVHLVMVFNDVILFYPPSVRPMLVDYARQAGTDYLAVMSKIRDYNNLRGQFDGALAQLEDKERAIHTLTAVCQERESLLQRCSENGKVFLYTESIDGKGQKDGGNNDVAECLARLECGNSAILDMIKTMQSRMKQDLDIDAAVEHRSDSVSLALLQEICDARLEVIRKQQAAISALRVYSIPARLAGFFNLHRYPKIGRLSHHPPISMQLWGLPSTPDYQQADGWPSISIVTPSFDQAEFIGRTIDSVLNQGYYNLEYFVQDGGSTDGTLDILKVYSSRLTGWKSAPDGGQSHALNLGFAKTHGEIMAWLNSDDLLLPGTLAYVADYFARHPKIDVVYGHRILIDEQDKEIGRWILPRHDDAALSWADYIPQETLFWRRPIWEKVGAQIDESFRFAMDWELLLRFRKAGAKMICLPRFLGAFRIHEAQKTSAAISKVGAHEMDRLRVRELGYLPSRGRIGKALAPYLLRHMIADIGWRIRYRLGMDG